MRKLTRTQWITLLKAAPIFLIVGVVVGGVALRLLFLAVINGLFVEALAFFVLFCAAGGLVKVMWKGTWPTNKQ